MGKRHHGALFDALVGSLRALISPGDYPRLRSETSSPWDRDWVEKIPNPIITPAWPGLLALLDEHLRDSKLSFPWSVIRDYLHACHLYRSANAILIRPLIPPTQTHPPFARATHRVYMSA